jgi:hypothetical protein
MSRLPRILLAALLAAAGTISIAQSAHADTVVCEKFGPTTIQGGKYVVQNNNWGDDTTQCINVTNTGFTLTRSDHNKPTNGAPGSYPSVYAGCHYGNCSANSGLPMRVSDGALQNVTTSVSMSFASGQWDAAYDIWFDPTARTDGQNTGAELMVWLNHAGAPQPVGGRVATVNIAGGTWDVWFGNIGWNVVSYVRTAGTGSINFAVRDFYNDMLARGYAQNSWYLTSVQAGFEPWQGGAGLAVTNFSYSTSGGGGTARTIVGQVRTAASTSTPRAPPTVRRSSCGTATEPAPRSGSAPATPSSTRSRASAWMRPGRGRRTVRRCRSGTATWAVRRPTRSGLSVKRGAFTDKAPRVRPARPSERRTRGPSAGGGDQHRVFADAVAPAGVDLGLDEVLGG